MLLALIWVSNDRIHINYVEEFLEYSLDFRCWMFLEMFYVCVVSEYKVLN